MLDSIVCNYNSYGTSIAAGDCAPWNEMLTACPDAENGLANIDDWYYSSENYYNMGRHWAFLVYADMAPEFGMGCYCEGFWINGPDQTALADQDYIGWEDSDFEYGNGWGDYDTFNLPECKTCPDAYFVEDACTMDCGDGYFDYYYYTNDSDEIVFKYYCEYYACDAGTDADGYCVDWCWYGYSCTDDEEPVCSCLSEDDIEWDMFTESAWTCTDAFMCAYDPPMPGSFAWEEAKDADGKPLTRWREGYFELAADMYASCLEWDDFAAKFSTIKIYEGQTESILEGNTNSVENQDVTYLCWEGRAV